MGWMIFLGGAFSLAIAFFSHRRGRKIGAEQGFRNGINAGRQRAWDAGFKAGKKLIEPRMQQLEQQVAKVGERATKLYAEAYIDGENNQRKMQHVGMQRMNGNFGRVEVQ